MTERGTALGYLIVVLWAVGGTVLVTLVPFATRSVPHRAAGVVFAPGFDDRSSVASIVRADPRARLLDIRWGGRLIFVDYDDVNLPAALRKAGALYMFDAIAAGCHPPAASVARR